MNVLWKKLIAGFVMFWAVLFIGGNYQGSISISACQVIFGMALYGIMLIVLKDNVFIECFENHKKKEIILEDISIAYFMPGRVEE